MDANNIINKLSDINEDNNLKDLTSNVILDKFYANGENKFTKTYVTNNRAININTNSPLSLFLAVESQKRTPEEIRNN